MPNLPTQLNKSQQRDISKILVNGASLGDDYMARKLSALYRSAMKTSQQNTILAIALAYGVVSNPEFIIARDALTATRKAEIIDFATSLRLDSNPQFSL